LIRHFMEVLGAIGIIDWLRHSYGVGCCYQCKKAIDMVMLYGVFGTNNKEY